MHLLEQVQSSARIHSASMLAIEKKRTIASHAQASRFDTSQLGHCLRCMFGRTTCVVDIFIVLTLYGWLVMQSVCALFYQLGLVLCAAMAHDICTLVDFRTQMIALP